GRGAGGGAGGRGGGGGGGGRGGGGGGGGGEGGGRAGGRGGGGEGRRPGARRDRRPPALAGRPPAVEGRQPQDRRGGRACGGPDRALRGLRLQDDRRPVRGQAGGAARRLGPHPRGSQLRQHRARRARAHRPPAQARGQEADADPVRGGGRHRRGG